MYDIWTKVNFSFRSESHIENEITIKIVQCARIEAVVSKRYNLVEKGGGKHDFFWNPTMYDSKCHIDLLNDHLWPTCLRFLHLFFCSYLTVSMQQLIQTDLPIIVDSWDPFLRYQSKAFVFKMLITEWNEYYALQHFVFSNSHFIAPIRIQERHLRLHSTSAASGHFFNFLVHPVAPKFFPMEL
jgi:hypothetical protein